MKHAVRLSLGFLSLVFPLTAFAAAPGNVTGIKAALADGKVTVSWNKADGDIASYRVFFSHASILKEGGLYDDFDTADGAANTYVFPTLPPVDTLYVSVLAVNKQGEESPYFVEEASVRLATQAAASSQPLIAQGGAVSTSLRLLKAEKASGTGILLTFSDTVSTTASDLAPLFTVEFGSGFSLPVTKSDARGNTVLLTTFPMTPGTVYLVAVTGDVTGTNANGQALTMDQNQLPVFVQDATVPQQTVSDHADVTNLRLRAIAEGNKRYTVEASWNAPNAQGVDGFVIAQSIDGGRTYGPALKVSGTSRAVTIPHVTASTLGIAIRTVYADGQASKGIFQSVTLGNGQTSGTVSSKPSAPAPVGSVTGQNNHGGSLPESGLNIWVLLTLTGAAVAWKKMRLQRVEA